MALKAGDLKTKPSTSSSDKLLEKVYIGDLLPGGKLPYLPPIKLRSPPKDGVDRFAKSFLHKHRQSEKTKKLVVNIM